MVATGDNSDRWDTHNQGTAIVINNAVLRGIIRFVVGLCKPTQPMGIAADEKAALAFARGISEVRSYKKEKKDKQKEKHASGGGRGGAGGRSRAATVA